MAMRAEGIMATAGTTMAGTTMAGTTMAGTMEDTMRVAGGA
jgi:hypothetical protein